MHKLVFSQNCDLAVADIGPLLVLKLNAFGGPIGRRHPKDAYDVLLAVTSFVDGASAALESFRGEGARGNAGFETFLRPPAKLADARNFKELLRRSIRLTGIPIDGAIEPGVLFLERIGHHVGGGIGDAGEAKWRMYFKSPATCTNLLTSWL